MGSINALVYAHHQHRQGLENPGNFGDCMKGRIRFMTAITPADAHAYQATCLSRRVPAILEKIRLLKPKARYPFPMLVPKHVKEAMISEDGPFIQTRVRVVDGEIFAGWGVIARSHHGRIDIMFGPVVTTEAHLAFSGARPHSYNTSEMTAIIEALSFRGSHGPVARDEELCIFLWFETRCWSLSGHDPSPYTCAAGARMSTIHDQCPTQAAAHHATRVRSKWNVGNECADHAAALGTIGLTSSHFVATRWIRNNFDASVCFDGCNNISEVLERLQHFRIDATSLPQNGS